MKPQAARLWEELSSSGWPTEGESKNWSVGYMMSSQPLRVPRGMKKLSLGGRDMKSSQAACIARWVGSRTLERDRKLVVVPPERRKARPGKKISPTA
jgi:hypothetical protein